MKTDMVSFADYTVWSVSECSEVRLSACGDIQDICCNFIKINVKGSYDTTYFSAASTRLDEQSDLNSGSHFSRNSSSSFTMLRMLLPLISAKHSSIARLNTSTYTPSAVSQWQAELSKIDDVASTRKLLTASMKKSVQLFYLIIFSYFFYYD